MTRDVTNLVVLLDQLISTWEDEIVEFKDVGDSYSTDKIGRYFAALANEANLKDASGGWLVFGVNNKTRRVCGTDYRVDHGRLQGLKHQIAQGTSPAMTFRDIKELFYRGKRVLLMDVPPAPRGMPVMWQGHFYARDGESLTSLSVAEMDSIRQQSSFDWTAVPVPSASVKNLDESALGTAREVFATKHSGSAPDIAAWSTEEFLARANLTLNGQITRAALLLLGNYSAAGLLNPHMAQITWRLIGEEEGYEHFGPPFILNANKVFQRIRNVELKLMRPGTLFAETLRKYEERIVLEAVHNAIAHQDYLQGSRIIVTEYVDRLEIVSAGNFFDGKPEEYVTTTRTPERYRNPFLVEAMGNLGMIETMGYGIRMMTLRQRERFLPLPDYDLSDGSHVKVTLYGRVVDEAYTRLLMERSDLPMVDVLALDRVQKGLPIDPSTRRRVKREGLIEGRSPHLSVAAVVAAATDKRAEYMRTRALDDSHYERLIIDYLDQFGSATRREIDALLLGKLSDLLDDEQKRSKVSNLLTRMKRDELVKRVGSKATGRWERA